MLFKNATHVSVYFINMHWKECMEADLSVASQGNYIMEVVTSDNPQSLDAYQALESTSLFIPVSTGNGARMAIYLEG